MKKPVTLTVCVLALHFAASSAFAQQTTNRPLPYSYAYGSLAVSSLETGGLEGGGSFSLTPNVHVFASYQDWEINENVDRSILQVGAGYHWGVSPTMDFVATLAVATSELDTPGPGDIDDDGLIFGFGLRNWLADTLEMSADVLLDDSLGSDVDAVIRVGAEYHVDPQFSIGGRVRVDEESTTLFFGARFYFGGN